MDPSKNQKHVGRFIGICSFYRKSIENFAKGAPHLTSLMSKKVSSEWIEKCQTVYEVLKSKMTEAHILVKADLTKVFELPPKILVMTLL